MYLAVLIALFTTTLFQPYVLDIHPVQMEATAHVQTLVCAKLDGVVPGVIQALYTYL